MRLSIITESSTTIITAHRAGRDRKRNAKALGSLIKDLHRLRTKFRFKSGRWRGEKETALIVRDLSLDDARKLMDKHDQESIIYNGKLVKRTDCYEL